MASAIEITYLQHSGFAVRTQDTLLIFDDAQGLPAEGDSLANGHITREMIAQYARAIYFVSHAHSDHFNPDIYKMGNVGLVHYVLGEDIPERYGGYRLQKGETLMLSGAQITAYGSTDEGVSFLVEIDGWTFFHAGDLNLWHWREESTLKEIEQAEKDFMEAVTPLVGKEIDFAFFPLDPRMGSMYDTGALYFLMHVKPHIMIPMHWWGRSDAATGFARRNRTKHVEIIALTEPGQTIRATRQDGGIIIEG